MAFNRRVVERLYNNFKNIYKRFSLAPYRMYDIDKTALTPVQETGKVLVKTDKDNCNISYLVRAELFRFVCNLFVNCFVYWRYLLHFYLIFFVRTYQTLCTPPN